MNNLTSVTLTGIDEHTSVDDIIAISNDFPAVEWGILYSPKVSDGAHPVPSEVAGQRYPRVRSIEKLLTELPGNVQMAIHVCGKGAADLINEEPIVTKLLKMAEAREKPARVQLNFNQSRTPVDLDRLTELMAKHPRLRFITQHNKANRSVWEHLGGVPNFSVLFDESGGNGIECKTWQSPLAGVECGYAGGLGPDNLRASMKHIVRAAAGGAFWIDMEGKLRDDLDRFDTAKARACLEEAAAGLVLASMSNQEIRDADRFCLICDDGEGYDIPKDRMKRLEELGLVKDKKFGQFEQTDLLLSIKHDLENLQIMKMGKKPKGYNL